MYILGFSCFYHDAAACLLKDAQVVAAAEQERFSRCKHDNSFPIDAMELCLAHEEIVAHELDAICFHEQPTTKFKRIIDRHIRHYPLSYGLFRRMLPRWFGEIFKVLSLPEMRLKASCPVFTYPHHLSHAASAFLTSPFEEAAILVVDAVGEHASTSWGIGQGTSVQLSEEIIYPHSLGMLYTAVTALLGFEVMEGEGKVMGLAAYGEPVYMDSFKQITTCFDDGSILLNPEYFAFDRKNRMMSRKLEKLLFKTRKPDEPLEQKHRDLASGVQHFLEERLLTMARYVREKSGKSRLCLAGGVALNSVANGKLAQSGIFDAVYVPPMPGDSGAAIGAALLHYHGKCSGERSLKELGSDLGTLYQQREIQNFLNIKEIPYRQITDETQLLNLIVKALVAGKFIGWFQGRMEFGPRALGHRSILAAPTRLEYKDLLNDKVKGRESFRPFGVSVLEEKASDYFKNAVPSRYMQFVFPVREEKRAIIPAVVHADNTCRIHTVPAQPVTRFRLLIEQYYKEAGIPMLINTSLNRKGEPIISNPREAYECFANTGLDMLVIDNYVIE